jgi:hypothetical protein
VIHQQIAGDLRHCGALQGSASVLSQKFRRSGGAMRDVMRWCKAGGLGVGLALVGLNAAFAQGTTEWKFFTYFPVNDKPAQLNRAFAEDVTKATGGRL